MLSYSGMRFAKILKDVHGDSISHAISQLLRGYVHCMNARVLMVFDVECNGMNEQKLYEIEEIQRNTIG